MVYIFTTFLLICLLIVTSVHAGDLFETDPDSRELKALLEPLQPDVSLYGCGPLRVPGGVLFKLDAPHARRVAVVGDFNSWQEPVELNDDDGDGVWIAITRLDPGTYQYKFKVDDQWRPDPCNPVEVDDAHGGRNSVVVVK